MKDATRISDYFYCPTRLFIIPLYQRRYAWEKKHCNRLFEDLKKIHDERLHSHFFGSIVTTRASEVEDDLLIIDGQQRITTLSILILAALNVVKNGDMLPGNEYLEEVKKNYLYAIRRKTERQIKLCPIEGDKEAYDALFTNESEEFVENTGMTSNYELFYHLISVCDLTFEDLISSIEKLEIIDIRLDSKDNPQLIFESLNSCGKDLEESDKVRNYLLMSLSASLQETYYRAYWSKIEKLTDGEPTMFIRDYLTLKKGTVSNMDDLYFDFKSYDMDSHIERQTLLEDMLYFAKFYRQILKGETGDSRIDRKLKQIANINSLVHLPYLLSFFDYAKRNVLDADEIYNVLDTIENYWARRIICNYAANILQKMFATLHNEIIKIYKRHKDRGNELSLPYSNVLNYILLKKQGTTSFPNDNEVITEFLTRKIYRIPPSYKIFLFERMENENSHEANDSIVEKMKSGDITIEHIMPQTLTLEWKEELGENWKEIHETYLHTFANLTLTGYNNSYSNHLFQEKREGYTDRKGNKIYGFKDSAFRLSNYLKQCSQWTIKEIKEREQILLGKFLRLWPMIKSEYVPLEKEYELVEFTDEEYELRYREIIGYRYRDERYPVENWKETLIQVCKHLYNENPTIMTYLANQNLWVHNGNKKGSSKFAENCYVHTSCDTKTKRIILNYLFKECNVPPSVLEFELTPQTEKVTDVEEE